jgi:signal transduction histidine kinase
MKITIRTKLLAGYFTFFLLFAAISIFALKAIYDLKENIGKTNDHPLKVSLASVQVEVSIMAIHRTMKDVVLSKSKKERESYLAEIEIFKKDIRSNFEIMRNRILGEEGMSLVLDAQKQYHNWEPIRKNVLALMESGEIERAQKITMGIGKSHVVNLNRKINSIQVYAAGKANDFNIKSTEIASNSLTFIIISKIIIAIIGILIVLFPSLSITKRLLILENAARKISEGDLKIKIDIKGNDELNMLANSFNFMSVQLTELYGSQEDKVKDRTQKLEKANQQLTQMKADLEIKVEERTREINEKVKKLNKSQRAMLYMVEDLNDTSNVLKSTRDELLVKERLAVLGQFAGSISHEIRNPLAVIDSSVYYIKERLKDRDEKVNEHLDRIQKSIKKSIDIIQSLLNLTRLKEPEYELTNINDIISDCFLKFNNLENLKLSLNADSTETIINSDRSQLYMVFKNIIRNAIDAMDGVGSLEVSIIKTQNKGIEISFKDSGPGIPDEIKNKIFQPLFTTKAQGIGFGLSIVKMIIENQNGTIEIESELDKGANFIITLPGLN